jgi:hypothetical protein
MNLYNMPMGSGKSDLGCHTDHFKHPMGLSK